MASLKHGEPREGAARKGFFTRWFESIAESRVRHAKHEMSKHHLDVPEWARLGEEHQQEAEPRETPRAKH